MALLKDATRIYGRANVDNQLTVGSLATSNVTRSTSNTTGTIVLVGNAGIATRGNIYSGNIVITGAVNSNGITFVDGTRQVTSALEKSNTLTQTVSGSVIFTQDVVVRGTITEDTGNNTVIFGSSSPVLIQNNTASTSNATGSLIVSSGVGVSGNIYVGGTNAGANGVYTDVLRYAANGLPWVIGVPSTAWTSYTPTITAATGSFTTVSATGAYQVIGKTCFVTINISITTVGTAAGTIYATLPFTSAARIQIGGYGMEVNSTGNMLKGYIPASSTQLQITTYSNGSTIGAGYSPILTVVYEIA
jgi:hypothetical protein